MINISLNGVTVTLSDEAVATIKKLAFALLRGTGSVPVEPVPVPVPMPSIALPGDFDELFYLMSYNDVANAVKSGMFKSGADHYVQHGWKEDRVYKPAVVQKPQPQPQPQPEKWSPADTYANRSIARSAFAQHPEFDQVILIDGESGFADSVARFGPAIQYYVWNDGSVHRGVRDPKPEDVPIN